MVEEEPQLLTVDEINALYNKGDANIAVDIEGTSDDIEGSLYKAEVDVVDIDDNRVDVGHVIGNIAGLQDTKKCVGTFNYDPLMSYTAMLQVAEEAEACYKQPSSWTVHM